MKKMIKGLLLVVLTIISMGAVIAEVYAEETSREVRVYLHRDYADCVFFVSWENKSQSAVVQIKDPDGAEVPITDQNTVYQSGQAAVNVIDAKSGYWIVTVTGENLGSITISGGDKDGTAAQYNAIQQFAAEVSDTDIHFNWMIAAETDTVNVSIEATQGGSNKNLALWNDYSASKEGDVSVSVDALPTGIYSFRIHVYDGGTQYTLATEEPIYVQQADAPEKLEHIKVGSIDGEMFATWDMRIDAGYIVTLYDYETLEVIQSEEAKTNYYPITLPAGTTRIKCSVSAVEGKSYGAFDVYPIVSSTPNGEITFPDVSVTKDSSLTLNVECAPELTAGVYLNGSLVLEDAEPGVYELNLAEGTHEVIAYLKDSNENMKTFTKSITVDKTPPVINLNVGGKQKTSLDRFILEGNTEPNAVVAVNGVEQELGSGHFAAKLALANGTNQITVTSYDEAGNKAMQTITIERTGTLGTNWLVYIVPGAVFLLLTVWYIWLNRKVKGDKQQ